MTFCTKEHLFFSYWISFHCWLRSRYASWEKQKLVFCDALTAGVRKKGRKKAESNGFCAPVTVRRKPDLFLRKVTSDFLKKRNGGTGSSVTRSELRFPVVFLLFFGCFKFPLTWAGKIPYIFHILEKRSVLSQKLSHWGKVTFLLSEICPILGHVMSGEILSCPACSLQRALCSPEPARSTSLFIFGVTIC